MSLCMQLILKLQNIDLFNSFKQTKDSLFGNLKPNICFAVAFVLGGVGACGCMFSLFLCSSRA